MKKPLVSIITITYNAAKVLSPTMKSVASQTFKDFEHIVVDGASADDTISIARNEGTDSLRLLSEKDSGIYDAMNKGMRLSRGEYLLFLNAGDSFASPHSLAHYAAAIADGAPDIIYADTDIVGPDRRVLRPRHLSAPEFLTKRSFSKGMLVCHQAFMVKRSIAPLYDLTYRFSADYDWTIRCIMATSPDRCRRLPEVEIHYLDNGATEQNKRESLRERFAIMRKHYGSSTAILRHISFIPRAVARKIKGK